MPNNAAKRLEHHMQDDSGISSSFYTWALSLEVSLGLMGSVVGFTTPTPPVAPAPPIPLPALTDGALAEEMGGVCDQETGAKDCV